MTNSQLLERVLGLDFGRIQFTSDLLPTDIVGVSVIDVAAGSLTFRPGPVFHQVVLADEINRPTPRTQSALLTVVGLAGCFASLLPLHHETLAEQSLTALTFLLAIKVFDLKKRRDHLQILAVSLLVIAGAASLLLFVLRRLPGVAVAAAVGAAYSLYRHISPCRPLHGDTASGGSRPQPEAARDASRLNPRPG